jgi:hypothetical protein
VESGSRGRVQAAQLQALLAMTSCTGWAGALPPSLEDLLTPLVPFDLTETLGLQVRKMRLRDVTCKWNKMPFPLGPCHHWKPSKIGKNANRHP